MQPLETLPQTSSGSLEGTRERSCIVMGGYTRLLRGKQLWRTALGRSVAGEVDEKHSVKRMDDLLGNTLSQIRSSAASEARRPRGPQS
jgi:hypothetical protein